MLRIYQKFMFVVCMASMMFLMLGLLPETMREQKEPEENEGDVLSVGYNRRGQFINRNGFIQKWHMNATDFHPFGNDTRNSRFIVVDHTNLSINGNHFVNQSANTSKVRPDKCNSCFPKFTYIYKNKNLCSTYDSKHIKLLVIIFTIHNDVKTRNTLRKTWLSISNNNTGELRYVFLLGKHTRKNNWNIEALKEAKTHGDILIKDFMDVYRNLTLKTMSGLQWAVEFCSNAEYVMKTDADMWVNTPRLLHFLDSFKIKNEIIGSCFSKAMPVRKKTSKWYVSMQQYPFKYFPEFCSGTGYVTTMQVVKDIVKISPNTPYFHLEDVYIGLCMKALKYKLRSVKGFNRYKMKFSACEYQKLITSHHIPQSDIEKAWSTKCWNYL
ncbi:unnamed protein product [Owenia fusiformis]|uniref:Hexosyltransferase n=1 Tax=Owenia fusiformis TaxID=6347 RepID=A0A8J1UEN0_OWEFU|nr:unnamed protein product [Owenia fusiformis]